MSKEKQRQTIEQAIEELRRAAENPELDVRDRIGAESLAIFMPAIAVWIPHVMSKEPDPNVAVNYLCDACVSVLFTTLDTMLDADSPEELTDDVCKRVMRLLAIAKTVRGSNSNIQAKRGVLH